MGWCHIPWWAWVWWLAGGLHMNPGQHKVSAPHWCKLWVAKRWNTRQAGHCLCCLFVVCIHTGCVQPLCVGSVTQRCRTKASNLTFIHSKKTFKNYEMLLSCYYRGTETAVCVSTRGAWLSVGGPPPLVSQAQRPRVSHQRGGPPGSIYTTSPPDQR